MSIAGRGDSLRLSSLHAKLRTLTLHLKLNMP